MVSAIQPGSLTQCSQSSPSGLSETRSIERVQQIVCRTFSNRDFVFIYFASAADADEFVKNHGKRFVVLCEKSDKPNVVQIYDQKEEAKTDAILKAVKEVFGDQILLQDQAGLQEEFGERIIKKIPITYVY